MLPKVDAIGFSQELSLLAYCRARGESVVCGPIIFVGLWRHASGRQAKAGCRGITVDEFVRRSIGAGSAQSLPFVVVTA
jgi:hypothetical protein